MSDVLNTDKNVVVGQKLNLTKELGPAGLALVLIALGWDLNAANNGKTFDGDLAIVLAGADGKAKKENVIYWGQRQSVLLPGAVDLSEDNLDGKGDGDDETAKLDFSKLGEDIERVFIYASIYQADQKGQNFGMLQNAFCRVDNMGVTPAATLAKLELDFDASTATGVRFATFIKRNGEWHFSAENVTIANGIDGIVAEHVA